jgi:hypothetical protein
MKVLARSAALVVCGFVLGTALVPVAAQQGATGDGQLAVRSDGAVYLITNGQRRWVATLVMDDATLNAIPEGEPIYGGLGALGSGSARSGTTQGSGTPSASGGSTSSAATRTPEPKRTGTPGPTAAAVENSDRIELDIESIPDAKDGDTIKVTFHTNIKRQGSCELRIIYPDGEVKDQASKTPDNNGECEWKPKLNTDSNGRAKAEGIVREGGDQRLEVEEFEIKKK